MSQYDGGVISKTAPVTTGGESGTAPGIWTMDQAMQRIKAGTWPVQPVLRHLWSWGEGAIAGSVGDNAAVSRSSPVQIGSGAIWVTLGGGYCTGFGVKTDGTAWSWGKGLVGSTGQNDTTDRSSPTQIGALTNWLKIVGGSYFSIGLKTNGTVWSWGASGTGQTGLNAIVNTSSPVQVGAGATWNAIACGITHTLAVTTAGTLWAWGGDVTNGQLGDGQKIKRSSPVQVGALTTWLRVAAMAYGSVGITSAGTLFTWGAAGNGSLGDSTTVDKSSPVQVGLLTNWSSGGGAAGLNGNTLLKTDGTLWSWGYNGEGELGANIAPTVHVSSPVQIGALTTWAAVARTEGSGVAKKADGTLWAWGGNGYGAVGDKTTANRSSPVQVGALTTWLYLGAGKYNVYAVGSH